LAPLIAGVSAIAAALAFGISSVADQRSTKLVKTRHGLSPRILLDLIRQPLWVTAVGVNVVGFALQVTALAFGSLALVQPLILCDLVFAVLMSWWLWRRAHMPGQGRGRWALIMFSAVATTTVGVAGFLTIGRPSPGGTQVGVYVLPTLTVGLVVVVAGCLAVAARAQNARPLAMALACGVTYGAAAFLVKLVTSDAHGGLPGLFGNWPIYVLVVVGPLGFLLNQHAFQSGTLLAPVQAIIAAADPVISIALGILWLGVRLRGGPGEIVGEAASLLLMVTGIVITAAHAPRLAASAAGLTGATPRVAPDRLHHPHATCDTPAAEARPARYESRARSW
jgi:hypothetical protein